VNIAVVSSRQSAALTRATVRRAVAADPSARVNVLDVDGSYASVGSERVLISEDVGLARGELHRSAARLEPADLVRSLYPRLVRTILADQTSESEQTVLVMRPRRAADQPTCRDTRGCRDLWALPDRPRATGLPRGWSVARRRGRRTGRLLLAGVPCPAWPAGRAR